MITLRQLSLAAAAITVTTSASARLVQLDYEVPGDGWLTWDTRTRIEWLDLNRNAADPNYTPQERLSLLLAAFPGFRQATGDEVFGLLSSAGVCLPTTRDRLFATKGCVASAPAVTHLQQLVGLTAGYHSGITAVSTWNEPSWGWFAAPNRLAYGMTNTSAIVGVGQGPQWGGAFAIEFAGLPPGPAPDDFSNSFTAFWLVREASPAPEPATYGMTLLGLGLVAAATKRRTRLLRKVASC